MAPCEVCRASLRPMSIINPLISHASLSIIFTDMLEGLLRTPQGGLSPLLTTHQAPVVVLTPPWNTLSLSPAKLPLQSPPPTILLHHFVEISNSVMNAFLLPSVQ